MKIMINAFHSYYCTKKQEEIKISLLLHEKLFNEIMGKCIKSNN